MKKRNTLVHPSLFETSAGDPIELSVHKLSAAIIPEVLPTLPQVPKDRIKELLVVPTFQKTVCPVIEWTEEARVEKDRLLDVFVAFARELVQEVNAAAPAGEEYWGDYVDPATGYTSVRGATPYSEAAATEALLPYSLVHVGQSGGGCNMISHPRWDLHCYPATMFFLCPAEVLQAALCKIARVVEADASR